MVINSGEKSPFEIRDSTGREFKEIYDIQGRLLFKNWSELSGIPPLNFTSRADYLQDYRIYGNTVQDGTPTPENPVEVQGVGEYDSELDGYKIPVMMTEQPHILFTETIDELVRRGASWSIKNGVVSVTGTATGQSNPFSVMENRAGMSGDFLITKNNENTRITISCSIVKNGVTSYDSLESILHLDGTETRVAFFPQVQAGTYDNTCTPTIQQVITTPVYLGSEPLHKIGDYADYVDFKRGVVVRRIKKLVLTGKEDYSLYEYATYLKLPYTIFVETDTEIPSTKSTKYMKCSHFRVINTNTPTASLRYGMCSYGTGRRSSSNFGRLLIGMDSSSADDFDSMKNFIAAQYSAGTPVTIWYVIATPEEEPLENLLPIQTIRGSDVLTADTTVQPSEMYIKYRR